MPDVMLMLNPPKDSDRYLKSKRASFEILPRVGEYITVAGPDGIGQALKVEGLAHSATGSGIDIFVRYYGTEAALTRKFTSAPLQQFYEQKEG